MTSFSLLRNNLNWRHIIIHPSLLIPWYNSWSFTTIWQRKHVLEFLLVIEIGIACQIDDIFCCHLSIFFPQLIFMFRRKSPFTFELKKIPTRIFNYVLMSKLGSLFALRHCSATLSWFCFVACNRSQYYKITLPLQILIKS